MKLLPAAISQRIERTAFNIVSRALTFASAAGIIRVSGPISEGYPLFYGSSPRALRDSLMISPSGFNIRYYARRLARSNEHVGRFLMRAKQTAFFADRVEPPVLRGVDPDVATLVAGAWAEWWSGAIGSRGMMTGARFEKLAFRDWLVDGEVFVEFDPVSLLLVPSDVVPDEFHKPEIMVKMPSGREVQANTLIHVAIIESHWQLRGRSWLAKALPVAWPNMEARDNVATGIQQVSKIAATMENEQVGSARGLPSLDGRGGYDAMESRTGDAGSPSFAGAVRPMQAGVIDDLKAGAKLTQPAYGPPDDVTKFSADQLSDIAIALGVSETELTGDHQKHNFASLQVAEARDMKTYASLRQDWYEVFRVPIYCRWLDAAIGSGQLPAAMVMPYYRQLRLPRWTGPRLMSAQPLKDAQALKEFAKLGLVNLSHMAAADGENADRNAEENAKVLEHTDWLLRRIALIENDPNSSGGGGI